MLPDLIEWDVFHGYMIKNRPTVYLPVLSTSVCVCHNLSKLAVRLSCFNILHQWSLFMASIIQTAQGFDPVYVTYWLIDSCLCPQILSRGRLCLSDTFVRDRSCPGCDTFAGVREEIWVALYWIWIQIRSCSCQKQQEWIFAFGASLSSVVQVLLVRASKRISPPRCHTADLWSKMDENM